MKHFNSLNKTKQNKNSINAGADPGFSNRGGAKDCVHAAHIPTALRLGLQGPCEN